MIEVIDRIPTYPGRVKLIPVPGQADTYDMVRADAPIVQGTPINKATLLTDAVANRFGLEGDPTVNEALALAALKWTLTAALLPLSGWSTTEPYTQTVKATGVIADGARCMVDVAAGPSTFDAFTEAGVRATEQGDGTLTFVATSLPKGDIIANIRTALI
jgi:hypothetical protein